MENVEVKNPFCFFITSNIEQNLHKTFEIFILKKCSLWIYNNRDNVNFKRSESRVRCLYKIFERKVRNRLA